MKRFEVRIKFVGGDELHSRVVAKDQSAAMKRILDDGSIMEKVAGFGEISSIDIVPLGDYVPVTDNPDRFILQPSKDEGWCVATDKVNGIVVRFQEGLFNQTAKVTMLDDKEPSAIDSATALRELSEWLAVYHPGIAVDEDSQRYHNRIRIGRLIAERRRELGMSLRQLAELSGVSYQNITKIENGRYNVSVDILGKLCDALGMKIDINGL